MKKLLLLLLKFSAPLIGVLLLYIILDPFKVIWHYDSFYDENYNVGVHLDKDYASTANYDNRYRQEHYNSFIFGNSRSIIYEIGEWKKYLPKDSKAYHFDASAESLYGINKKIKYIDSKQEKLDNVLLILDHNILSRHKPGEGHLFAISPQVMGYSNTVHFHYTFLRTFLSPKFFTAYTHYKITGEVKPYMTKTALNTEAFLYDKRTNEMRYTIVEKKIADGDYYTPEYIKIFYKRGKTQQYSPAVIKQAQKELLSDIAGIFAKQGTHCKIIINPLYDQKKLNPADLAFLKKIFGDSSVCDFSGINSITKDYRNYYETSHYRPQVAEIILKEIYTP